MPSLPTGKLCKSPGSSRFSREVGRAASCAAAGGVPRWGKGGSSGASPAGSGQACTATTSGSTRVGVSQCGVGGRVAPGVGGTRAHTSVCVVSRAQVYRTSLCGDQGEGEGQAIPYCFRQKLPEKPSCRTQQSAAAFFNTVLYVPAAHRRPLLQCHSPHVHNCCSKASGRKAAPSLPPGQGELVGMGACLLRPSAVAPPLSRLRPSLPMDSRWLC